MEKQQRVVKLLRLNQGYEDFKDDCKSILNMLEIYQENMEKDYCYILPLKGKKSWIFQFGTAAADGLEWRFCS
jgi:hypothetical protein